MVETTFGEKENISLWKAMWLFERKKYILALILRIFSDGITVALPLAFREFGGSLKLEELDITFGLRLILLIPVALFIQDLFR